MEINLKTQWNKLNSLFRVAIILFSFPFFAIYGYMVSDHNVCPKIV